MMNKGIFTICLTVLLFTGAFNGYTVGDTSEFKNSTCIFNPPEGWIKSQENENSVKFIGPTEDGFVVQLQVWFGTVNITGNLGDFFIKIVNESMEKIEHISFTNCSIISSKNRTVNGMNAYEIVISFNITNNNISRQVRQKQVMVEQNGKAVIFWYLPGTLKTYEKYDNLIEQSLNSLIIRSKPMTIPDILLLFVYLTPFILLPCILIYGLYRITINKSAKLLQQQALKRQGVIKKEKRLFYPTNILFPYDDTSIVYSIKYGKPARTVVEFKFIPQVDCTLEINETGKALIETGNPLFDELFYITAGDTNNALNLLTENIQKKLLEFKDTFTGSRYVPPVITVKKGKFTLTFESSLKTEKEYELLLDTTLMFYDRMKELGWLKKTKDYL